jgi:triacylglycerol lipase
MSWLGSVRDLALDWTYAAYWETRHFLTPGRIGRYGNGPLPAVLLLPGVYETWEFLRPVADRLNALGHPIHVVPKFGYNRGSIPSMAALAQRYVDSHDLTGVIIVAHSKGGLIGKHMMVLDDRAGRIARMVAVNTPFGGSPYAKWALRRTLREFLPTDVTLAALTADLVANSRIASVYSSLDPVIPGGSELEGAMNVRLPLVGHFRVLSLPALLDTIEDLITHPPGR